MKRIITINSNNITKSLEVKTFKNIVIILISL